LLGFLSVLLFSQVNSYLQFHLVYIALSLAITMCGLLPGMVIINGWFQKNRGLATGIFLLGSSFGGILFPQIASRLITEYGWREAAIGIALLSAFVSFIPIIFIKNKAEDVGQNRDGEINPLDAILPQSPTANNKSQTQTIKVADLLRSPVFYVLLFITAAFWFCGFGVLQNLRLYLQDYGFSLQRAANTGKVTFGYLSDRFNKMNILFLATVFLIAGVASLRLVRLDENFAYLYTAFYGFGYSGAFAMIQLTVAELYKGQSFSKVLGIVNSFDSIGGFAGVGLLGYLRTHDGNYDRAMNMLLVVCAFAFVLAVLLRRMTVKPAKL
jgi:sugar phosphate permease